MDKKATITSLHTEAMRLYQAKNFLAAMQQFKLILAKHPNHAITLFNIGTCYSKLHEYQQAIDYYQQSLMIDDKHIPCLHNLAACYNEIADFSSAITYYQKILQINAKDAPALYNIGILQLLHGDFAAGWRNYHYRFQIKPHLDANRYSENKALQKHHDINNKTIIIAHEQGLGDAIQMIRYTKLLKEKNVYVIVEAFPVLKPLFASIPWIDEIFDAGYPTPKHDYFIPMLSLPWYFQTDASNIPLDIPYIHANPDKVAAFAKLFPQTSQKRIGFVWAGRPQHVDDHKRSLALTTFKPVIETVAAQFYSFQIDQHQQDLAQPQLQDKVIDLSPYIHDFADTAALVAHLDLVIAIDTALIHLAAAINKPTWAMISYVPDWRWLLNREDSIWYPSIKLYRQPKLNDWDSVMQKIIAAL